MRKGELSKSQIDRDFPYQIALPADECKGKYFEVIRATSAALGAAPSDHSVRQDDRDYVVFCFPNAANAKGFMNACGGEPFNPAGRGRGKSWFVWWRRT
jgi:hypothetical protein